MIAVEGIVPFYLARCVACVACVLSLERKRLVEYKSLSNACFSTFSPFVSKMIGVKRAHPDTASREPAAKRQKVDGERIQRPRKKYRVKRSDVLVQVFDLGNDVRLVQRLYRHTRTFF
jgi:hypothetical protein